MLRTLSRFPRNGLKSPWMIPVSFSGVDNSRRLSSVSFVPQSRPMTDEEVSALKFGSWLHQMQFLPIVDSGAYEQRSNDDDPSETEWDIILRASMASFALHVQSRVHALEGKAFYTIGPCGEEFACVWGTLLEDCDSSALHYRHLASQLARQLKRGRPFEDILLDRARGYVCSRLDPVTGGRHCALGGDEGDFYVTSTLASQGPPAVGRALGVSFTPSSKQQREVHFVSFGDGSVNNAHFLSAKNLAENAAFRNVKCPVLFCITDNDISISFKGKGWMKAFAETFRMPVFKCNGRDILSVYSTSKVAFNQVRTSQKPAVIFVENVNRRFGHAATDRQAAYLAQAEIEKRKEDNSILESVCTSAVHAGVSSYTKLINLWECVQADCKVAFEKALLEPKLDDIAEIMSKNQAFYSTSGTVRTRVLPTDKTNIAARMTMRKCMNRALFEQMQGRKNLIYMGEDVAFGGYYAVTDDLAKAFPGRVLDFVPDETALIGCGQGFSQRGMLPIVEIPYLKYLDCGVDQYFEVIYTHWITNGRQNQGMVFRLQGFDRGVFGGSHHTHNSLYLPPGLDVLCFSNGSDWVRGFRAALKAAESGRIVAIVDPTHALNKRHVSEGDDAWLCEYPPLGPDEANFEDIILYPPRDTSPMQSNIRRRLVIITYGNGVPDAILAQSSLDTESKREWQVDVVDCPYLSKVPNSLIESLKKADAVLFADCCKFGQNPFGSFVQTLNTTGLLPQNWLVVAAVPTYNPLSRTETFLSYSTIKNGMDTLMHKHKVL